MFRNNTAKMSVQEKLVKFTRELVAKECPKKLSFKECKTDTAIENRVQMTAEDFKFMEEILVSDKLSNDFELDLSHITIGKEGAEMLARSLAHLPENFTLNLKRSNIGNEEAKILAPALKNAPKGFALLLNFNGNIGVAGMKAIVDALPFCPERFKLNIVDAKYFRSHYKPPFTYKSTAWNYAYDSVCRVLIDPIVSQKSKTWPRGLHLCVDQFIPLMTAVADGFKKNSFPEEFHLEFGEFNPSGMSIHADTEIIKSLADSKCVGVSINHRFPPYKERFSFFSRHSFPIIELLEKGTYPVNMHLDFTQHWDWTARSHPRFPTVSEVTANQMLANALKLNKGPRWSLTIDFIIIDDLGKSSIVPGWEAILDALKYNKNLSGLRINRINLPMAEALLDALKVNNTLIDISFNYNKTEIPAEIIAKIEEFQTMNCKGTRDRIETTMNECKSIKLR